MNKPVFFFIALFFNLGIFAQNSLKLTEGKPVFVYSLPKTEFCFELEIEKTTQKQGQFYQFSERYLATNKVITEDKIAYRLKSINVKQQAVPDPKRTYQIEVKAGNFLTVDKSGLLCGVNIPFKTESIEKLIVVNKKEADIEQKTLLPLSEEFLMAGSTAKLAEGAAKQIYRIRESRMTLLSGDMDQLPSDGKAFESMLKGLDKSEQDLTELFVGKQTIETMKHTIFLTPDSAFTKKVLFRLSALRGLVDATDLGGSPYFISLKSDEIQVVAPDPKSKPEETSINTILPASTKVTITDGIKTYYNGVFFIPQFGVIIPVSEKTFNLPKVKIKIDNLTGRLLGVEK